jgi:hypothetical protein
MGVLMKNIYQNTIIIVPIVSVLFFIFLVSPVVADAPAIEWQKSLGGSGIDMGSSIQQTADGGYIVAGTSNSTDGNVTRNHGRFDYWVVKLDAIGNIQWQKCLGGSGDDEGTSVQQTTDGGYIVAGSSDSTDGDVAGNHVIEDYWVVKLDASGNIQWQKSFGGSGQDWPRSIQQTNDGGYIVVGWSSSTDGDVRGNQGRWDYWVVKLDASGNIQWQKCLGGSGDDEGTSVQQTTDGGYIVAGTSRSNDGDVSQHHGPNQPAGTTLFSDYWVVKLDSDGNIVWEKSLGGSYNEEAYNIRQTNDGGFIVAGDTDTPNNGDVSGNHGDGNSDYWIVKLDVNGKIDWQKCLGGFGWDDGSSIQQTNDDGYIVAGTSHSNDGDVTGHHNKSGDYWIVNLDGSGNLQWQKSLGGSRYDQPESIRQTNDGGYIIIGWSNSDDGDVTGNHGCWDYWVVKLSGNNLSPPIISTNATSNNLKTEISIKPLLAKENQAPSLTILDAKMISPNELGIAVKVKYPESCPSTAKRWITFEATINGKSVKKSIDVTKYTVPGREWEETGSQNLMSDIYGNVQPNTPIRINLEEESVPRFSNNIKFTLQGIASYEGGDSSNPSSIPVKILLPVIVLHGYVANQTIEIFGQKINIDILGYPEGNTVASSYNLKIFNLIYLYEKLKFITIREEAFNEAYRELSENLIQDGYNKEKDWGIIYKFPFTLIFNAKRYVTLGDPQDSDIGYSSPSFATTDDLNGDFARILDLAKKYSYADRINIIGHSTGGLVARYWSSQKPAQVNKIITVGTPHEGIARFYEEPFLEQYKNRNDFENQRMMTEQNGNIPNLISWFAPRWDAIDQSIYTIKSSDPNPYFTNTFDYQYSPEVNYYLIYGMYRQPTDALTPYRITIDIRKNGKWYDYKQIITRSGDGYVFWESAANNNGPKKSYISRIPIDNLNYQHADMMNDPQVIDEIKRILND